MSESAPTPEECFTLDPELIFVQATDVNRLNFILFDGTEADFLVFARIARVEAPDGVACDAAGLCVGCEIAAYQCERSGYVIDWERRYEVGGTNSDRAINKLRYQLANGLASMSNYEGALADFKAN